VHLWKFSAELSAGFFLRALPILRSSYLPMTHYMPILSDVNCIDSARVRIVIAQIAVICTAKMSKLREMFYVLSVLCCQEYGIRRSLPLAARSV